MAGFGLGNYINPAVGGWIDQRRNALAGLGAGLLQGRPGAGVQEGIQADDAYATMQKAETERQANIAKTQAWLQQHFPQYAGLPADAGLSFAQSAEAANRSAAGGGNLPASIQEYQFYANQTLKAGQAPKPYDEWRQGSNQTVRAGLGQPVPLRNKVTGETVPFMPMSDGTYMNPLSQTVADQNWEFDPAYIQAQKSQGAAVGTAVGNTQFNLPAAKQNVDLEIANIDAILADKEGLSQTFGNAVSVGPVGLPNQWLPTLPNTPKANLAERVKQVVGQNFLQAFSSLKGAGAITEVEGSKAQEAMARLGSAQDQKSFETALNDLKAVLQIGYDRMSQQAGTLPSVGGGNAPAGGATYTFNPVTGELE